MAKRRTGAGSNDSFQRKLSILLVVLFFAFLVTSGVAVYEYFQLQDLRAENRELSEEVSGLENQTNQVEELKQRISQLKESRSTVCRKDNPCESLSPGDSYRCDSNFTADTDGDYLCACSTSCEPRFS